MKNMHLLILGLLVISTNLIAQVAINTDGTPPDSSAMLEVKSSNRGLLPPRMSSSQVNAIVSPANGLIVYDTTLKIPIYFDGSHWCDFNGMVLNTEFPAGALFVSPTGTDAVTSGSMSSPFLTISYALNRAVLLGSGNVFVANGVYNETIELKNGVNLLGGYDATNWKRNMEATQTILRGTGVINDHKVTVIAYNITGNTRLEGFVIYGLNSVVAGHNSYAIYISAASNQFVIAHNVIFSGNGAPGIDGLSGSDGANGVNGTGRDSNPSGYDAFITSGSPCNISNNRQYSNGGVIYAGTDNISGGNGGGNHCPPVYGTEASGTDGFNGHGDVTLGGAAGTGGDAGDDGRIQNSICNVPTNPMYGINGTDGSDGLNGSAGSGGNNVVGTITSGHWFAGTGINGGKGGNGGFGGGGGGGCGGNSYGIYWYNVSGTSNYTLDNNFSGGMAGSGGKGGESLGNKGISGSDGIMVNCGNY